MPVIKEATDLAKEPGLTTPYVAGEQPEAQVTKGRLDSIRGRGNSVSPSPNLSRQGRGKSSKVSIPSILVIKGGV